jgi:hypothetical protein
MKNKILFFLVFLFSITSSSYCVSIGNLSAPSIIEEGFFISDDKSINFRLGFDYTISSDLMFKFTKELRNDSFCNSKIACFSPTGSFTFNIKERLDLYVNLGFGKFYPNFFWNNDQYYAQTSNGFLWQTGAKFVLIEINDFSLGADIKYFDSRANIDYFSQNHSVLDSRNSKLIYHGYNLGIGISEKINIFYPYLGISYNQKICKLKNISFYQKKLRLNNRKKVGVFLGTSISKGSYIFINIEGRFINERSLSISGELRF